MRADIAIPTAEAFCRCLLRLDTFVGLDPAIAEAVALLTEVIDAGFGYVELFSGESNVVAFRHAYGDVAASEIEPWVSRTSGREMGR